MNIKQVTLWSFLTQSRATREIVCPDDLRISIEEFAVELKARLKANQLPAEAELTQVNWDDTHTTQQLILIRYTGNQATTKVLQYTVNLEQLGNFTYLEKRILLVPPKLPEPRQTRNPQKLLVKQYHKSIDGRSRVALLILLVAIAFYPVFFLIQAAIKHGVPSTLVWCIAMLFLSIFFWFSWRQITRRVESENVAIDKHNQVAEQKNKEIEHQNIEIEAWNRKIQETNDLRQQMIHRWHNDIVEVIYLSSANDVFGRWSSAVSTTIDQVMQKLFVDRHAQAKQWEEERKSQEEIEKALKQRSAEAFG